MMKKFGRKALALSLTAVLGASMVLTGLNNKDWSYNWFGFRHNSRYFYYDLVR